MAKSAEKVEEPENAPDNVRKIGHNSGLSTASLEYFVEMIRIKAEREILNADADLARHTARNQELNTKALDAELREFQAKNDEKEGWRESREVGRAVLKDKKQGDLFEILEEAKSDRKAQNQERRKADKNAAKS